MGPILAPLTQISAQKFFLKILPVLGVRHCCKLLFYPISRKTNEPNIYYGQLSPCTISEKTNDPILRKLSDGRTDRRTDGRTEGQTDESDFIRCCPTDVERPEMEKI